jgi:serine/threonine-protein kinase
MNCDGRVRYSVREKLGTGGMAEVFLAVASGPGGFERSAVLKRIRPDLVHSAMYVKMFLDEAKLSARLVHPNIVQVYEFGRADECLFLALEHVPGRDLAWMMSRLPHRAVVPTPAVAAEIARQCCLALDYAHNLVDEKGVPLEIVHRDVTPSNIMVGFDGTVKLLDFGVAHATPEIHAAQTDAGVIKGKLSYVAPEQLQGRPVDRRSDLFSLGVVLHELLSWRRLFHAPSDHETVRMVLEAPIAPPSQRNRTVPAALDKIVLRALARDPAQRYASAGEMVEDLERYLLRAHHPPSEMRRVLRERFGALFCGAERERTWIDPPRAAPTLDAESCIIDAARAPAPRRLRWQLSLLAIVCLFFGIGGGLVSRRAPPPPPPRAPAPPIAIAVPPLRRVALSFDSLPQGATVLDARGNPLGETPLVLQVNRATEQIGYTLRLPGHLPAELRVIPDQDKPVLALLRPWLRVGRSLVSVGRLTAAK